MSRQVERPPLHLRPWPSSRLASLLLAIHTAAAAVAVALPLVWPWRALLLAAVLLSGVYMAAGPVLRRLPWSVREAVWQPDGAWTLTLGSGEEIEGRLLASSYVSTALVVLNFRCSGWRPCSLVLFPDGLEPDVLRRLRVRLRLAGGRVPDQGQGGT
jgi:toxin CptA